MASSTFMLARANSFNRAAISSPAPLSANDLSRPLPFTGSSHDLAMVRHLSHRVAVMHLGQIVELASRDELFTRSLHPYTHALISAVPEPDPDLEKNRYTLSGPPEIELGEVNYVPCRFYDRCKEKKAICSEIAPLLKEVTPGHWVACHHFA